MSITQSEFARRIGISLTAVRKGLKSGRIALGPDGKLDESMLERWHSSRDPSKVARNSGVEKQRHGGVAAKPATVESSQEALEGFDVLKTKKLAVDLEIAREELANVRRDTVNRDQVRRALTSYARLVRDKWVNFPNRYGQQIAAALGCDAKALMAEMDKAVRLQLEEVANTKATLPE